MKKNLHPEQVECTFKCACGATFKAMSNKEEQQLEVCSECHPFYTGAQVRTSKSSNVDKFNRRAAQAKK
jgi:large subunit ribosomal protein L31